VEQSTTATVYLHRSSAAVLADIRDQISAVLPDGPLRAARPAAAG